MAVPEIDDLKEHGGVWHNPINKKSFVNHCLFYVWQGILCASGLVWVGGLLHRLRGGNGWVSALDGGRF